MILLIIYDSHEGKTSVLRNLEGRSLDLVSIAGVSYIVKKPINGPMSFRDLIYVQSELSLVVIDFKNVQPRVQ